ncbi:brachyurin-like [Ceratitis capitata]|uniref:brachyurin-like n=1 Tax=Ceratitis capitata TaxID=7213 RepID=UPI0006189155|nr:brachyurin-like [Ceratitis capitata]
MKLLVVFAVCLFGCVAATGNEIDWAEVKPRDVEPQVPFHPRSSLNGVEGRITNGQVAVPKQFPYQAGLRLYTPLGASWCGGSVISDRWILTAAHCTVNLTTGVDVYLGAWDRTDATEPNQHIIFVATKNVILHEDYDGDAIVNDISLIKLPFAVEFNDYIQPIALPKKAASYDTYVGKQVIASGWGRISDDAKTVTDKLRWIEVPVLANTACNRYFLGSVKQSNICIKTTGGISTCNGDSGGPLVYNDGEDTVLVGATSFGILFGCQIGWPGVFTRITSYLDWIEQHTGVVNN